MTIADAAAAVINDDGCFVWMIHAILIEIVVFFCVCHRCSSVALNFKISIAVVRFSQAMLVWMDCARRELLRCG